MLANVCLGTNDLERAGAFYDAVLAPMGLERLSTDDREIGYGVSGGDPMLWVLKPINGEAATSGNGTQASFEASSSDAVDQFYRLAIERGAVDEGPSGPRDYYPGYYGAYCRDLDGNKLHAFIILK